MNYLTGILESFGFDRPVLAGLDNYSPRDGFELVDPDDYKGMAEYFDQYPVYRDIIPLLTDNESNYISVYKSGILFGKVCCLDHEEPSLEPRFRNVGNLLSAISGNPGCRDLSELPEDAFDYPQKDKAFSGEDRKILESLHHAFNQEEDDDVKTQIAFCIMNLTPAGSIEDIYPFLDSDDTYIQERAIRILGIHRYKPAAGKLRELLLTAKHNGKTAAKIALTKIENG